MMMATVIEGRGSVNENEIMNMASGGNQEQSRMLY